MKRLRDILKEDASDLTGGSLEGTLKGPHLKSMAENMKEDAQRIHGTDFNELHPIHQKKIFDNHLKKLQDMSGIQFDGYYNRKYKVQKLLKKYHGIHVNNTSETMTPEKIKKAKELIASGYTQKGAAKELGAAPGTLRGRGITNPNTSRPPNDPEFIQDVLNRREQGHSASQIAKNLNTTKNKIIGIWNRHG
jgi:hypothetical protein